MRTYWAVQLRRDGGVVREEPVGGVYVSLLLVPQPTLPESVLQNRRSAPVFCQSAVHGRTQAGESDGAAKGVRDAELG